MMGRKEETFKLGQRQECNISKAYLESLLLSQQEETATSWQRSRFLQDGGNRVGSAAGRRCRAT
jgi:hypothetical protein